MGSKIIFLAGIHGIGKTTFCETISSELDVEHFSAGELISRINKEEYSNNKIVTDVTGNQNSLLSAVNKYLQHGRWYLLDGHFCLMNKDDSISEIPYQIFKTLSLMGIIVFFDDIDCIRDRLNKRDNVTYDIDLLNSFQEQELTYSKLVADKLGIPYFKCNPFNTNNGLTLFIQNIMDKMVLS